MPVIVGGFHGNNYIEYESNGERNKTLSLNEYFNEIKTHLEHMINIQNIS